MAFTQCYHFSVIGTTAMTIATTSEEIKVQILLNTLKHLRRKLRQLKNSNKIKIFSQGTLQKNLSKFSKEQHFINRWHAIWWIWQKNGLIKQKVQKWEIYFCSAKKQFLIGTWGVLEQNYSQFFPKRRKSILK